LPPPGLLGFPPTHRKGVLTVSNGISTDVQPYDFHGNPVRVIMIGGEPWFVAADVCAVLGIDNARQAMARLDDDEYQQVASTVISNDGGPARHVVSESGLYSLVLGSRKPDARRFKRWVTSEVLPQIRRTGAYAVSADPFDVMQGMLDTMRAQRDHLAQHDRAILELGARAERLEAGYERLAATGFANLRGLRHDVSYLNRLGRAAAAIARRDGVPVEKAHSTIFGTVNAWPVEVWDEALTRVGG
jgi:prophage antirepressor-like protein